MHLPVIPENAPFDQSQRLWLNGYLAGLFSGAGSPPSAISVVEEGPQLGSLLFVYGTQTGGAETLARKFVKDAKERGFDAALANMEAFSEIDLSMQRRLAIVVSTYGDGEMPDSAQAFWEFLNSERAPGLSHAEFSVLALGDTNYPLFCEAGKKFDARLAELGARRVHDRVDCDADFEKPAADWLSGFLLKLADDAAVSPAVEVATVTPVAFGKNRPFPARLKTNQRISQAASAKETRHIELVLEGSGLVYEAGDALGVLPRNCEEFVAEILHASRHHGEEIVTLPDGSQTTLRSALNENFELKPFLTTLPEPGKSPEEIIAPLRKLQPRLYSISSSPKAHPGEVHLTVSVVRYNLDGRARKGACSTFLADHETRAGADSSAPVFVHRSPHFKLPSDPTQPVIMVGPGTGIAPFRSFLQERRAIAATGDNWLFFGDQKRATDFLYEDEIISMAKDRLLTRLDLAFSRDQTEKVYVQHRMIEQAAELWKWFQNGAAFYVCGDAFRMAKDVEAALLQVAQQAGGHSSDTAAEWLSQLKREKRYLRDVY